MNLREEAQAARPAACTTVLHAFCPAGPNDLAWLAPYTPRTGLRTITTIMANALALSPPKIGSIAMPVALGAFTASAILLIT